MEKQLYHLLIHATDEEGPFYQNYYPYGTNLDEAINETALYLAEWDHREVAIVEHAEFDIDRLPHNDMVQDEDFDGFIHNVRYGMRRSKYSHCAHPIEVISYLKVRLIASQKSL